MDEHTTHHAVTAPASATETFEIALDDVFCPCCQDDLAAAISRLPHVTGAHVDLEHKVAHVTLHAGMIDAATLRSQIEGCNFRSPVPLPKAEVSSLEAMHHAAAKTAAHGGREAMGHDMSDPRMAAAIEPDMRRRFWIALVLSSPRRRVLAPGTPHLSGRELPSRVTRLTVHDRHRNARLRVLAGVTDGPRRRTGHVVFKNIGKVEHELISGPIRCMGMDT